VFSNVAVGAHFLLRWCNLVGVPIYVPGHLPGLLWNRYIRCPAVHKTISHLTSDIGNCPWRVWDKYSGRLRVASNVLHHVKILCHEH